LPRPVKLFRKPALFQKLLFQLPELLVEQAVGLVDQASLIGLQLAEPAAGIDKTAWFDHFPAPVARMVNVYAPQTRSGYMSNFSDFIDMFLERVEIIDTSARKQSV
jgi:hypothetical protein